LIWSEDLLRESKAQLDGWYRVLLNASAKFDLDTEPSYLVPRLELSFPEEFSIHVGSSLWHDVSLPEVITTLSALKDRIASGHDHGVDGNNPRIIPFSPKRHWKLARELRDLANLLGLLQRDPDEWFRGNVTAEERAEFKALADARHAARQAKDWAEADRIRDEGTARGIIFEDSADGTKWRKA